MHWLKEIWNDAVAAKFQIVMTWFTKMTNDPKIHTIYTIE